MKKITKLFTGVVMASMMLGSTSFASTQGFSFRLRQGQLLSTSNYSKADNEQKAYVHTKSGDMTSSDQVWFKVKSRDNSIYTNAAWVNTYRRFTLNYRRRASRGGAYHLNGQQDSSCPYSVTVRGTWTP